RRRAGGGVRGHVALHQVCLALLLKALHGTLHRFEDLPRGGSDIQRGRGHSQARANTLQNPLAAWIVSTQIPYSFFTPFPDSPFFQSSRNECAGSGAGARFLLQARMGSKMLPPSPIP